MLAATKINSRSHFTAKIYWAYKTYQQICWHGEESLNHDERITKMKRAALERGLEYPTGDIEPKIVRAMLALGDKNKSEAERADAITEAWTAYTKHWNVTLH